ncbi:hypothetical protein CEP52_016388 [Fusarium oligoseptatum]|uniref:Xylanolytic transcriptional activator regulatory domain-containing protein n=1 Tax=Fusarium oligoseptatum TaxID=2604345 RepID=A0A428S468_9HYPO|nr:hypothetical protein CEP52_016388 [Fusarium oligoseptatum]
MLGRRIKEARLQSTVSINPAASLDIPRLTADRLLELYISSFEPIFPILHIPSLKDDYGRYWNDHAQVPTVFRVQLQLVLALGSCLFDDTFTLRDQASRWVNEAQLWLLTPPEKSRMTIPGIQIMILLTLARSVCGAGPDTVWVLTGLLLRTAMYMGLHRDPSKLGDGKMTVFRAEMRRRLWLSILELNLQSAYDAGGAPLISVDDYDTLPPGSLDDENLINEPENPSLSGRTEGGTTHLSAALALAQSLPLRLKILRHANDFRAQDSYNETFRLNSELVQACHKLSQTLERLSCSPSGTITQFHVSLAELLAYRCFHTLHQPIIVRSLSDPKYYFSQKMYIDGALKIAHISGLARAEDTDESNVTRSSPMTALHGKHIATNERLSPYDDDPNNVQTSGDNHRGLPDALFARLLTNGAGMFRNIPIQATLGIILAFVSKWGENSAERASTGIGCLPGIHSTRKVDFAALGSFLNAARGWTLRRIRSGEVSIKGHYFLTCYLRHVSAIEGDIGKDVIEESVVAGAIEAAELCLRELKSTAEAQGLSFQGGSSSYDDIRLPELDMDIPEFGNGGMDVMDMDWMGDWVLDGTTGFDNFS